MRLLPILSLAAVLLAGCQRDAAPAAATQEAAGTPPPTPAEVVVDRHSFSEPDKVKTTDLALDLVVDFEARELVGSATLQLDWLDDSATQLVLDTRELSIEQVEGAGVEGVFVPLTFELADADPVLGSKLSINTPSRPERVRISYRTSPQASGLQWLEPSMTEGKQQPFMFSQSQQIHARSWVPLQDTPRIRFTYSATVKAPADTMVLMSADNKPDAARTGEYSFKMPQPIPSYLLAIAAGDLVFKPISERAGVWAEPAMVERATSEFGDTETMIQTAEKLYGPYRWERYDILVLPPSFPYGGMENPRLTFATPTVIVGDKSLVALIAHELAHSWSGNLVTFATSEDGWLNEGFTSYVENRIVEALFGKERSEMEYVIERNDLKTEFASLDPKLTVLATRPGDLPDPDSYSSSATAYTKGAWFLQFLEQRVGRDTFDAFLRDYFDHFAFQGITTTQFVDYLKTNLVDKHPEKLAMAEVEAWVYEPGVPDFAPKVESRRFAVVDAGRTAWLGSGELPSPQVTGEWTTQEWVYFIERMPESLSAEQIAQLDEAYAFTGTANGEVAMRWYPLVVRSGQTATAEPEIAAFLERIGRRKLILPIYSALVRSAEGKAFAQRVFDQARPGYHPITTGSVERILADARPAE
ncbi:MAG: M1 family metallopeptidase [Pseudoxanthomonas suwonensis]|nr:M1 family metallopeptidase [Pseudoxanthomonas suwonensis]